MKNITVTLDEKTAAWARVYAAKRGVGLSRLLGDLIHERMREARDYYESMQRFLSKKPFKFKFIDGHRPTRGELHDRSRLR